MRLIAACIPWFVLEMRRAVSPSATEVVKVPSAAPTTIIERTVAINASATVKPASLCLRIRGHVGHEHVLARAGGRSIPDDDAQLAQRLADVADLDLACEAEEWLPDVVGRAQQAVRSRFDDLGYGAVVVGVDESVGARVTHVARAIAEDAAVGADGLVN